MKATRLVTLAWLFCHVGQYTISIFILFSNLSNVATQRSAKPAKGERGRYIATGRPPADSCGDWTPSPSLNELIRIWRFQLVVCATPNMHNKIATTAAIAALWVKAKPASAITPTII